MTLMDLINELAKVYKDHGNLPVVINDSESGYQIAERLVVNASDVVSGPVVIVEHDNLSKRS